MVPGGEGGEGGGGGCDALARTGSRERSPKVVEDARPPWNSVVALGCRPVAPAL